MVILESFGDLAYFKWNDPSFSVKYSDIQIHVLNSPPPLSRLGTGTAMLWRS